MSLVWLLCQCAGLLKPARSLICLCVLAGFLWLVPLRTATVRASVIAGLFCLAVLLRRRPNPLNTLSLAAFILLLVRPTQLLEAGWQLSFSSVLGILLMSARLNAWGQEHLLASCPATDSAVGRVLHHILRSGLTLVTVGLGAWLGSAALLAYHFYCITPLGVLYTLLALPVVSGILMIGCVHILLAVICPLACPVTLAILTPLSSGLIALISGLSLMPGSYVLLGAISWVPVTLYYGSLLPGLLWKRPWPGRGLIALALTLPLAWVQAPKLWQHRRSIVELTCLSVGHGQALVLQTPGQHTFLFDAGSLYQKDIGRRTVSAYLDYRGISTLDAIVLSHNDADHINGVPEVLQHCRVAKVYAPTLMIDQAKMGQGPTPWLQAYLHTQSRTLEPLPARLSLDSGLTIEQLWPPLHAVGHQLSDNNASLVLLITYAQRTILITSDIEQATQEQLMDRHPSLQPDVLLAPHHGSLTTLSETFLNRLSPKIVLCSCSAGQMARRQVIGGPTTYHTPMMGAITLRLGNRRPVTVEGWLWSPRTEGTLSTEDPQ